MVFASLIISSQFSAIFQPSSHSFPHTFFLSPLSASSSLPTTFTSLQAYTHLPLVLLYLSILHLSLSILRLLLGLGSYLHSAFYLLCASFRLLPAAWENAKRVILHGKLVQPGIAVSAFTENKIKSFCAPFRVRKWNRTYFLISLSFTGTFVNIYIL